MNVENLKKGNPETQFKSGQQAVEAGRKGGLKTLYETIMLPFTNLTVKMVNKFEKR